MPRHSKCFTVCMSFEVYDFFLFSPAVRRPTVALEAEVRVAQTAGGLAPPAGDVDHVGRLVLRAEGRPLVALQGNKRRCGGGTGTGGGQPLIVQIGITCLCTCIARGTRVPEPK